MNLRDTINDSDMILVGIGESFQEDFSSITIDDKIISELSKIDSSNLDIDKINKKLDLFYTELNDDNIIKIVEEVNKWI